MRIPCDEIVEQLTITLNKYGFEANKARKSAELFAQNSLDGVYSHGINRFSRVISYLQKGYIKPENDPECIQSFGAIGEMGREPRNESIWQQILEM